MINKFGASFTSIGTFVILADLFQLDMLWGFGLFFFLLGTIMCFTTQKKVVSK